MSITQSLVLYLRCFPALVKGYGIHVGADGTFDPGDLLRASASTVMVQAEIGR